MSIHVQLVEPNWAGFFVYICVAVVVGGVLRLLVGSWMTDLIVVSAATLAPAALIRWDAHPGGVLVAVVTVNIVLVIGMLLLAVAQDDSGFMAEGLCMIGMIFWAVYADQLLLISFS